MDWPPDFEAEYRRRIANLERIRGQSDKVPLIKAYYAEHPLDFIRDWCTTYDPRNGDNDMPREMPFLPFDKQAELVQFIRCLIESQTGGIIEKSRDMGATWLCSAFSVWMWLFLPGSAVGWGSRKETLVDRKGDPSSIFEKIRILIERTPKEFKPIGFKRDQHFAHMRIINPETGATITGEAGDNIGRGGRTSIYFKDESAHYERPDMIEAALSENTNVQVDISSVNGVGNVFYRRRQAADVWDGGDMSRDRTYAFIMDWRDHPAKTQSWYDDRKAKAESEGLAHLFAQEIDRDYTSAVEGILIPGKWVKAAIGAANVVGGVDATGRLMAALDVADEGLDKNAFAARKGPHLLIAQDWREGDTAQTANKAVRLAQEIGAEDLFYDSIGVGAGVKAETNRLRDIGRLGSLNVIGWNAAGAVLKPEENLIPGDIQSPLNKDFYQNLKAQAAWNLRRRFEETYKAVNGRPFNPEMLIFLDEDMENLRAVEAELSQPTYAHSPQTGKLVVNKKPDGSKSPNYFDSIATAYWPIPSAGVDYERLIQM